MVGPIRGSVGAVAFGKKNAGRRSRKRADARTLMNIYSSYNHLDQKKFRVLLPREVRARVMTTPTKDFTLEELDDLDDDFLLTSFSLKVVDKI